MADEKNKIKSIKKSVKKPTRLKKLLLNGPTWSDKQYEEWVKDAKYIRKWKIG